MEWWLDGTVAHPFEEGALLRTTIPDAKIQGAGWDVAVHVRASQGRLIIDELEIRPESGTEHVAAVSIDGRVVLPGGPGLSLRTARREITAMIQRDLDADPKTSNWPAVWRLALGFWEPGFAVSRPGRKGLPPYDHALIAAAYVEARRRDPRQLYTTMRDLLGAKGRLYSLSSLPKAVSNARRLGYLTETPTRRRAGGDLTEQGTRALKQAEFDGFAPEVERMPTRPHTRRKGKTT
jgi:hypothetical protein